jgi:hypothetical protein
VIVFLHIPKTGGTTFRFILENSLGIFNCHAHQTRRESFSQSDFEFVRKIFPGLKSIAGHNLVDPLHLSFPDPFFITFMREPVARVISHYQDTVLRGNNQQSFEECVRTKEDLHNLQVRLMAGEANVDKAKRFLEKCGAVGLTEKFDLSLHLIDRLCPCKLDLHYQRRVVARDNATKESVQRDSRMLELAREYNRLDLELYDFAVKEVFPKLCEKAGLNLADKVSSYEIFSGGIHTRNQIGRFYNKVFRELYKLRSKVVRAP